MRSNQCEYCTRSGDRIAGKEDGLDSDLFVCKPCMKLLKNPTTGLQLIRGNVTISVRGSGNDRNVQSRINKFMEMLSSWKPMKKRN